jgi:Na+-transporting NADH:ubiquinone oxidoreductase subunit NqrB
MKLVTDWRQCWRWLSVHAMAGAIAVQAAWQVLDADLRASLPADWVRALTVALLVLGILGRVIDQDKPKA